VALLIQTDRQVARKRYGRRLMARTLIVGCAIAMVAFAQVDEYQVKAAFLYNFAKFVDWPAQAFHGPEDPICICIVGQNPFENSLEAVVRGQKVGGRSFRVRQISDISNKPDCHILFVCAAEQKRFQSMAGNLMGLAVLTVGESPRFATDGGVINLKLEGGKVRFEINMDAAEQAQLHISSKLLSLAEVIRKPGRAH
jgi:hypothetical protein